MTSEQTYDKFIIKINKNATTDGVGCDKGKFVIIFNEVQNKFPEYILDKKYEDDIRYIQQLLVEDKKIPSSTFHKDSQDFELPKNYFELSSIYGLASKEKCTNQIFDLFEIKNDDRNNILRDEFNKPSFKYREAPYNLGSNKVKVYKDNFTFENIVLSYYRYPLQISLSNPEDPESNFNPKTNPEWDDKILDRIISLAASEFELNNNSDKYQANKMNAAQKI